MINQTFNTTRHLVIGYGQIGRALCEVLCERYDDVDVLDLNITPTLGKKYDAIHVCIPYTTTFVKSVRSYAKKYSKPNALLIIHSTVELGTSKKLNAVHSPVRGVHPNLKAGIEEFLKFFGGPRAEEAARLFSLMGINVHTTDKAENTEALKLWDTTYYGWNIVFEKFVHEYCKKHKLDFDLVYRRANHTYNTGYEQLGMHDVTRPVLIHKDGPIGGHCVIPNAKLLGGKLAEFIIQEDFALQFHAHIKAATGKPWPKKKGCCRECGSRTKGGICQNYGCDTDAGHKGKQTGPVEGT